MQYKMFKTINFFDHQSLLSVQSWRQPSLNNFFTILTRTGTGKAWFFGALVFNILHSQEIDFVEHQLNFMRALFSPLLAWALGVTVKTFFSRGRPSIVITGFEPLIDAPTCGSFPSNHAATATAFFVALLLLNHPLAILVGIWAALISFSRLYLGVHYLSDVLGGVLVGVFSALATVFQFR